MISSTQTLIGKFKGPGYAELAPGPLSPTHPLGRQESLISSYLERFKYAVLDPLQRDQAVLDGPQQDGDGLGNG